MKKMNQYRDSAMFVFGGLVGAIITILCLILGS